MSRRRIHELLPRLAGLASRSPGKLAFMEVCGTHTVNAARGGVHSLLPENVRLISGPGCPVCVTAQRYIDALLEIGRREDVTLATYGDLLRVAGAGGSLELARSEGADVRVVTSTMEALAIARDRPDRELVFAGIGFETTAPATAAAVKAARKVGIANFSVVSCHKLVMPALAALLADPDLAIDGFLCPGHVSVVIGPGAYRPVAEEHGKPCVIAGFEPVQIVMGVLHLVEQAVGGEAIIENLYPQVVKPDGNPAARALLEEVFVPEDSAWRALGAIPESGLAFREEYREFDALPRFGLELGEDHEPPGCRCGEVITGKCSPADCGLFGDTCTPAYPVGPCMVSSEGACQAWFRYRRREVR